MTGRKTLLLVESNTTGSGRDFARRAAGLGAEPVLLTTDPARYAYVAADGLRFVIADTSSDASLLAAARSVAADRQVAGVTSSSDYYVLAAACLARTLHLPGPAPVAVRAGQHKGMQRQLLAAAGLPIPRYAIARTAGDALASARSIGFPVVVKPVQGSGSIGVRLCATERELSEHAQAVLSRTVNERNVKVASGVLVEEYIDANEFSVEVFHGDVIAVVRKHLGPHPHFVETGHDIPAGLGVADTEEIRRSAVRAVLALGLDWGAAHVEVRMRDGKGMVIEVNARLAGGMIPELVRHSAGVDLVELQVAAALGRDTEIGPVSNARAASIRFLVAERDSIIQEAEHIIAAAKSVPEVTDVSVYKTPGEYIASAVDFRGRIGHVLAVSDDASRARHGATESIALLHDQMLIPCAGRS
jgi:biotin carboxylase